MSLIVAIAIVAAIAIFVLWWFFGGKDVKAEGPTILESLKPLPQIMRQNLDKKQVDIPQPIPEYENVVPSAPPQEEYTEVVIPPRTTPYLDGYIPPYARNRKPSIGEQFTCKAMEKIYGVPFKSAWPPWLINPESGERLEIDCYNDDLMIGAEYQGYQHYTFPNTYHKTIDQFHKQLRHDAYKRQLCDNYGVFLIPVPYTVPNHLIEDHIRQYLPETILAKSHEIQ